MLAIDPIILDVIKRSHGVAAQVLIYNAATKIATVSALTSGTITADRTSKTRRTLSGEMAIHSWENAPIETSATRVQINLGVQYGAKVVYIPAGAFKVDSLRRTNRGTFSISGSSFESYVVEGTYHVPVTYAKGAMAIATIEAAIRNFYADAVFAPYDSAVVASNVALPTIVVGEFKASGWDVIDKIADLIDCDCYCLPDGRFTLRKKIQFATATSVAKIKEGNDGALITLDSSVSRDEVYNGVMAMGQSTSSDMPPVSDFVVVTDTNSPLRWGGPFGKKMFYYEDPLLTTKAKCKAKATALLDVYTSMMRDINLDAIPNPALEPDDLVEIDMLDGSVERHLLTKMTIPIGRGSWTANTVAGRRAQSQIGS